MKNKVLIIYPERSDLPLLDSEVKNLANNLPGAYLVPVNKDEDPIIQAIATNRGSIKGIWFASHSTGNVIELGSVSLGLHALVQYVQMAATDWVVFNICKGHDLATIVSGMTTADTLSVPFDVFDHDAWRMSHDLAQRLRESDLDLESAATLAGTGFVYQFRSGREDFAQARAGGDMQDPGGKEFLREIDRRVYRLELTFESQFQRIFEELAELKQGSDHRNDFDRSSWVFAAVSILVAVSYGGGLFWVILRTAGS